MAKRTEEQRRAEEWLPSIDEVVVSTVGILTIGGLYFVISDAVRVGPAWLLILLEALLVAPIFVTHIVLRRPMPHRLRRFLILGLLALLGVALIGSLARFIIALPSYARGPLLLLDGGILWVINVLVFATWYWELDGGGPHMRSVRAGQAQDFMFPQQQFVDPDHPSHWKPGFIDYLFLAFCFSTAFSPADSFPLTRGAKLLVMAQAAISLVIIGLIVSRAINILGSP
ncbi:MAG TPA: hypothetical protein VH349_02405 [Ktedonobacterales bacterium]|jgi:hypothetical protein